MHEELLTVRVSEIGEFIRHHSCERRFKLEFNNREAAKEVPFASRFFNPIDPVLQEAGKKRENEWENSLQEAGFADVVQDRKAAGNEEVISWEVFVECLQDSEDGQPAYGREIAVEAVLGAFRVTGQIDFVLLRWEEGRPKLLIVECKASRRDRTYHRVQVTLYMMAARTLVRADPINLAGASIQPEDIDCVVARIDETTNEIQAIVELQPLQDLEREEADINRLLAPDGTLMRIVQSGLSELDYRLDLKCDDCVFNVHCLPESAIERRLELLGIGPSTIRVLEEAGIAHIDDLASLELCSAQASEIRSDPGFTANLEILHQKARVRRRMLPQGDIDPDAYEVEPLPYNIEAQLPEHDIDGHRLVRVYMVVNYDYVENRLVGLSAHVTASQGQIRTPFVESDDGSWRPDPEIVEESATEEEVDENGLQESRPIQGRDVIQYVGSEWTGDYGLDTGAERQLIQAFFYDLIDAIAEIAEQDEAPIHFYVWSRTEMANLVDACARVDSRLLSHLRELLGCRESLDQLIYSCLQNEVDRRYALGWTGRGLGVATSLNWFGHRYHWTRRIGGVTVDLERSFTQDIFDFKTDLNLKADGSWAQNSAEAVTHHKFEIRSRFDDSLSAPYWRAYWRQLPDSDDPELDPTVRDAIRRYKVAERPGYLRGYLKARLHALRWIEERMRFKNSDIEKPLMTISELPDFSLGVTNTAQAAIDFLRLDHHVGATDWIVDHLVPPMNRVPNGRTIPVSNVRSLGDLEYRADINLQGYDISLHSLSARSTIAQDSWVRVSRCSNEPDRGQTIGQLTRAGKNCRVLGIDWESGEVRLAAMYMQASRYIFPSYVDREAGEVFDYATIDESPSDFVGGKVERRLRSGDGSHVYQWFDPENPQVPEQTPITGTAKDRFRELLEGLELPSGNSLVHNQISAIVDGLDARVQLLQGPPGTGKTTTTAIAVLLRILARCSVGDIVLIGANTHTALDNLLRQIDRSEDLFQEHAELEGLSLPSIGVTKVHSSVQGATEQEPVGRIINFAYQPSKRFVKTHRRDSVLVIGGTTSALLKLAREQSGGADFPDGFTADALIVDEASMMVFPHFLALCSLITPDGEVMLTGDPRQLAPIVAHDWENEDRPPIIVYQPFVSAYQAVQDIACDPSGVSEQAIKCSALKFTFRLPPIIRQLIARLYRLDDIELEGLPRQVSMSEDGSSVDPWERIWQGETGLFLVLHSERRSRLSNETEAEIVQSILEASEELQGGTAAVVTPYRAQRNLLRSQLGDHHEVVDVIDTVERLQGGERPVVIVSATASDPSAISSNVEFILNLNRSNVAFSRAQDRLIVVCSEEIVNHIPAEVDQYDSAMLWKSLRGWCSYLVARTTVGDHTVQIYTPPIAVTEDPAQT